MLFLRSLLFHIAFFANVFTLMLIWLPTLLAPRHASLALGRAWGRTSLWLLDKIVGVKVEFRGLENIPKGAVIVACKHQSTWETFVLPIHFPDFSFILKHELIYIPFFGWYLISAEQIAVDRAKGGKSASADHAQGQGAVRAGAAIVHLPRGNAPADRRAAAI